MENAANAVSSLFKAASSTNPEENQASTASSTNTNTSNTTTGRDVDTTLDAEVAPAVEHTHVKKTHETREQTNVEKEKHQDHYHTTVQPLTDNEVLPEKHDYTQTSKEREINRDDGSAKAKAEADRAGFASTADQKNFESKTVEPTTVGENVHHHLHETIQPVIEKEVIDPSVTHKRVDIHEKIQEPSKHHGVTTNSTLSREEFEKKIATAKN
ncbi:uncharacterized protein L3040_004818 [Drepanopeziza brunnea f. sp. 'multigermtubi']|nr:hypothetical protein L3040_004818 [Drepanopeziza brunnea f. sp. 'multigermtubi']